MTARQGETNRLVSIAPKYCPLAIAIFCPFTLTTSRVFTTARGDQTKPHNLERELLKETEMLIIARLGSL